MYDIHELSIECPASVEASVGELGEVLTKLDEACAYLTMLASKKFDELGVETSDEATELSPEYCNLIYLGDLVETAQELVEKQVAKALVGG